MRARQSASRTTQDDLSLRAQPLAALGAAAREHLAAILGRHAQTEPMPALTHEAGGLKGALHDDGSGELGASERAAIGEAPPEVNRGRPAERAREVSNNKLDNTGLRRLSSPSG